VRDPASSATPGAGFIPPEFQEMVDVAECALDEQMEQLQRRYASATRAAARARSELELLERRRPAASSCSGSSTHSRTGWR
jgi:hypothetical protein